MSQNKNSKFSDYISERFEVACQAANEFKVPLVFMDLDKIAENEYDTVNKKLEEYKKNGNSQLLQDILGQIRMNRVTDYGVNLFTDKYLYDSIVDIYDSKTIIEYADKYKLCSFEFSLYLSYFCDIVIQQFKKKKYIWRR